MTFARSSDATASPIHPIEFALRPDEFLAAIERPRHTLMRWNWIGALVMTCFGAGWFGVGVLDLTGIIDLNMPAWKAILALLMGSAALTFFCVRPLVEAVRTRAGHNATMRVTVDAAGVGAMRADGTSMQNPWVQLSRVYRAHGGVLLNFVDGQTYWIPRRAFATRDAFLSFADDVARIATSQAGAGI
jgi:hypothetical protein